MSKFTPPKFSLFKGSKGDKPIGTMTLEELYNNLISGTWAKEVAKVRKHNGTKFYKALKEKLPAVSISGDFKSRDKFTSVEKRLRAHSGRICIDVDKKDNPKLNSRQIIDKDCLLQHISAGGEGIKIIYACKPVKTREEHRRIFMAAMERLKAMKIIIKADPVVSSIASLQYVSYDPDAYYNPKSKLVLNPVPKKVQKKSAKVTEDKSEQMKQLTEYIAALDGKDITANYDDWLGIMFGLSHTFGEAGRKPMHDICKSYKGYSAEECDEKYDGCIALSYDHVEKPVTINTVFQLINQGLPKPKMKQLNKLYNVTHAVGVGEDTEQGDLALMVRYKLFLFKKVIDKETKEIVDLRPEKLNLNAFEALLKKLGFYRYERYFVHIVDNIVETIDASDILRIVTTYIEADGDYRFTYKGPEYFFSWEEIVLRWREFRGNGSIVAQIFASLTHWKTDNLLKDNAKESYIPYSNGVVRVTGKAIDLLPYSSITAQVWKDKILPRDFKQTNSVGMFERFFRNVMGRGHTDKERVASKEFNRSLWYYGYALQGTKRLSTARAWLLYDIRPGNNGRSGKTIIGLALAKIRAVAVIDGKRIDFADRFAFQNIEPWTEIVFIDDVAKGASLSPMFNMITGRTIVDKKGLAPVVKDDLKFVMSSNWVLESEGRSEAGRQFVSQLDDFYARWGQENGNTITPVLDFHKKEFFTDWNAGDWLQFDNFSAKAIQHHLRAAPPDNTIIGNSAMMRFIQTHEEELFFSLCMGLSANIVRLSDGALAVPQGIMSELVRGDGDLKANKAGRIVRAFLAAVGCRNVYITTIKIGGLVRHAYGLGITKWSDIDIGDYKKRIPPPKDV